MAVVITIVMLLALDMGEPSQAKPGEPVPADLARRAANTAGRAEPGERGIAISTGRRDRGQTEPGPPEGSDRDHAR